MADEIIPVSQKVETLTSTTTGPDPARDSQLFGVSVRAWIAVMVVGTICGMALGSMLISAYQGDFVFEIKEPLYGLAYGVVGYFFGQAAKKGQ